MSRLIRNNSDRKRDLSPSPPTTSEDDDREFFSKFTSDFNNMDRTGKSRLLPHLIAFVSSHERIGCHFLVSMKVDLSPSEKRIVHGFNLLDANRRNKMFTKVATYFVMRDVDFTLRANNEIETGTYITFAIDLRHESAEFKKKLREAMGSPSM